MLPPPSLARFMSSNLRGPGFPRHGCTAVPVDKLAPRLKILLSNHSPSVLHHIQTRNGSERSTRRGAANSESCFGNDPPDGKYRSKGIGSTFLPSFKSAVDLGHLEELLSNATPLELELLRNQTAPKVYKSATSADLETIQRKPNQAKSHTLAEMQAANLSMLDFYDDISLPGNNPVVDQHENHLADAIRVGESNFMDELSANSRSMVEINATLLEIGLKNPRISRQVAFELYRKLPSPGVSHLNPETQNRLLIKLSQVAVTEKDERAMMQYLSVFDDLHTAGIRTQPWQWGAAIHFSGRCFKQVTMNELESAMRIWQRMEEDAGIRSNIQTMNILLDIALKAGQLDIAELTLTEMRQRNLRFDRVTYLGIICLKGLRGDGDGIRQVYKDFVLANEVVDTMTLTCVMSALLNAGEVASATNLYQRMLSRCVPGRDSFETSPQRVWEIGRILAKSKPRHGTSTTLTSKIQESVTMGPNIITYVNLIGHHARHTGDMIAIAGLLDDMHAAGIPIHGSVFTELFRGFPRHCHTLFTSWTKARLEEVWLAFKNLDDTGARDVFAGPVVAIAILDAFKHCYGNHRALQVFEELRARWRKLDESHEFDEWWLKSVTGMHQDEAIPRFPQIGRPRMDNCK